MLRQIIVIFLTAMLVTACQDNDKTIVVASPSLTATATVTTTHTQTPSPTSSPTATTTHTPSPSDTATPSVTPTLEEPVLLVTAVMDGVVLDHNTAFDSQRSTIPPPAQILPDATHAPPSTYGWKTYESDHPALAYKGEWTKITSRQASRGQYHYSVELGASIRFDFEGTAVRVRYVAYSNGGQWQLWFDGQPMDKFDNFSEEAEFGTTEVFPLDNGPHTLDIRVLDDKHPASSDHMVAIDAIDVYQPVPQPQPTTPTTTPVSAQHIELLQGAPTIQPTATDEPPIVVNASVVIAYDENANRVIDLAEGVQGLPVRMVEVGTNRVLTQAFTDNAGFATLEAVTNQPVRLVVPYLGAYWDVRITNQAQTFNLLLPPGHQPGLIP